MVKFSNIVYYILYFMLFIVALNKKRTDTSQEWSHLNGYCRIISVSFQKPWTKMEFHNGKYYWTEGFLENGSLKYVWKDKIVGKGISREIAVNCKNDVIKKFRSKKEMYECHNRKSAEIWRLSRSIGNTVDQYRKWI